MVSSVMAPPRDQTRPLRTARGSTPRSWVIALTIFAVFAGGLGFMVGNEHQANIQTDQTHATQHATRRHLAIVESDLTAVRRQLQADSSTTAGVLSALAQDSTQLSGVRAELSGAESSMAIQGTAIVDLQVCLGGVEQALNALSVGDLGQALSHLSAVGASCEKVPVGG